MTIVDNKVSPAAGIAKKLLTLGITSAIDQTKTILDIIQIPYSFAVERVGVYASAVTDVVTADVRIVPRLPNGSLLDAAVLTIGGTKHYFKINAAIRALGPLSIAPAVSPALLYKAITDNNHFSSAFTINAAAAAGLFWGAVRVQVTLAGVVSTKVVSADQVFATEAQALASVPASDNGLIDLGTITIQTKTAEAFTANTTDLDDATAVNVTHYNSRATSASSVLTGEVAFVATEKVFGVPKAQISDRCAPVLGGLLVVDYTSSHTGVLVNGKVDVDYRPYPMAGETLVPGAIPAA